MLFKIKDLRCNYLINPLGVGTRNPKLSWMIVSDQAPCNQTAYRILVSESLESLNSEIGDCWDTGRIESDRSNFIQYLGKTLGSRKMCFWKVCIWQGNSDQPEWSDTAFWETGLFSSSDFRGNWIGAPVDGNKLSDDAAPFFRKSVHITNKPVSARAYICGLGYYELYINGQKAGTNVLSPAFTKYDSTVLYDTHDITELLCDGENEIGVVLGNGFYNSSPDDAWDFNYASWRDKPKFLLQIYIEQKTSELLTIQSDSSWRTSPGPIVFNALRNGEYYDARRELIGWNCPCFDDSGWQSAVIVKSPGGILKSQQMTPIKVTEVIKPLEVILVRPGVFVYDFGRNISGWARLRASGTSGTELIFRYSESISKDGCLDRENIDGLITKGEFQTDRYIMKGNGEEVWEPRFVYHGFRYIEMTGFCGKPSLENLSACVVHTDFEESGGFSCSNEMFNNLQTLLKRSTLTNYHGIPTDCPHREKNGWTGDAQLSSEQTLLNFNPATAYTKWMDDFKDAQRPSGQLPGIIPTGGWGYNWGSGPAWDSAAIVIPWNLYLYCGDIGILSEMYDCIKKYIDYMTVMSANHIVGFGLGDWCPPGGPENYKCPIEVSDTSIYYSDTVIFCKIAKLLGKKEDEKQYAELAAQIKKAFREKFIDEDTGTVHGGCQTSMACALYHGIVDEGLKSKVFGALVREIEACDCKIDFGILGAKYIFVTLTKYGRVDLAYRIASQTDYPSWGYWVLQGATTLWETWDGNSSQNHHMFSSIGDWFYSCLAGLSPDEEQPGFKHILIKPHPVGNLTYAKAWHTSLYGTAESSWTLQNNVFTLNVVIPANCSASVFMPSVLKGSICISNMPDWQNKDFENGSPISLGSGSFSISADLQ
jgi:alpha-L-rhamnosidase